MFRMDSILDKRDCPDLFQLCELIHLISLKLSTKELPHYHSYLSFTLLNLKSNI